jgi:hypothetical protein
MPRCSVSWDEMTVRTRTLFISHLCASQGEKDLSPLKKGTPRLLRQGSAQTSGPRETALPMIFRGDGSHEQD